MSNQDNLNTESRSNSLLKTVDIVALVRSLWASRKTIAIVVVGASVLAAVVSLILPQTYRSTATLLPETEKSKLGSLGGLSDLAALAGVNVGGGGTTVKLYPPILKSETVLQNVILARYRTEEYSDSVNLIQYWDIHESTPARDFESALFALREMLEVALDNKTNVLTISIVTREPQLSAAIVGNAVKELDAFFRTKRTTNATEQRQWIEERISQVKEDLRSAENKLKDFREKNRRVGDSPQLLLEQERLIREVQLQGTVYTELKKQYELAKIEEIKNIPVISVVDSARAAAFREFPKRRNIVLIAFFVSFLGAVAFFAFNHVYGPMVRQKYKEMLRSGRETPEGGRE